GQLRTDTRLQAAAARRCTASDRRPGGTLTGGWRSQGRKADGTRAGREGRKAGRNGRRAGRKGGRAGSEGRRAGREGCCRPAAARDGRAEGDPRSADLRVARAADPEGDVQPARHRTEGGRGGGARRVEAGL